MMFRGGGGGWGVVKFLYQGHDVFDSFVPLLTECTELLWDIN